MLHNRTSLTERKRRKKWANFKSIDVNREKSGPRPNGLWFNVTITPTIVVQYKCKWFTDWCFFFFCVTWDTVSKTHRFCVHFIRLQVLLAEPLSCCFSFKSVLNSKQKTIRYPTKCNGEQSFWWDTDDGQIVDAFFFFRPANFRVKQSEYIHPVCSGEGEQTLSDKEEMYVFYGSNIIIS